MTKTKYFFIGLAIFLVALRLALPEIIKWKANKTLNQLPDYRGHIDGVHLALWRGAFALKDIQIEHKTGDFGVTIKRMSFGISWSHLFKRAIVADVDIVSPRLRMLVEKPAKTAKEVSQKTQDIDKDIQEKTGKNLPDLLADIIPFRIREFHLKDGSIRIQETGQDLKALQNKDKDIPQESKEGSEKEKALEARVTHLNVDVRNLTNTPDLTGTPYADGVVSAQLMDKGHLNMDLKLNPIAKQPTFDLDVAITDVNLAEWNPVLRWQAGMDVKEGTFALFFEAAARQGGFNGYIKPFIHKLKMHDDQQDAGKKLGTKIKEAVVDVAAAVFKNKNTQSVASRVPFEGKFDNPKIGVWEAIITVLRNAFIKALSPHLDKTVKHLP